MSTIPVILIGAGGHCASVIDVIEKTNRYTILGLLDHQQATSTKVFGYDVLGDDTQLLKWVEKKAQFVITIGQIKTAEPRKRLYELLKSYNATLPTIISPHAVIAKNTQIGDSTVIHHHVIINNGAKIGHNCIINSKALIEHESEIGHHSHISTGAIVNGQVKIGQEVFIGSNTTIRNNCTISSKSIIGMGQTIMKDC